MAVNKKALSERDICTKFIAPALRKAGWDEMLQIREEVGFTKGRIIVRGKLVARGQAKRADYVLYYKPNIPLTILVKYQVDVGFRPAREFDTANERWCVRTGESQRQVYLSFSKAYRGPNSAHFAQYLYGLFT